jgi:hypothetical protein
MKNAKILQRLILVNLIDECYICAIREDESKLLISCSEDAIDRVTGSVKKREYSSRTIPFLRLLLAEPGRWTQHIMLLSEKSPGAATGRDRPEADVQHGH